MGEHKEKESSNVQTNKLIVEAVMAKLTKLVDDKLEAFHLQRATVKPVQIQERQQKLNPKLLDHKPLSTWSSPHKTSHTPKSKVYLNSDFKRANELELYTFSGKRNYLEWERNMDDWFHYKCISKDKMVSCAIGQLKGDAYKWWCQEVDERWYYREPTIISWRKFKELLRKKYAPNSLVSKEPNQSLPIHQKSMKETENIESSIKTKEKLENELLELLNSYRKSMKAKCVLPSKSVKDKCDSPSEKCDIVLESNQACEKLILFKPVQPSSIDSFSQVLKEKSPNAQRCFPSIMDMEPSALTPRAPHYLASRGTIILDESMQHVLLGTRMSETNNLIQYWQKIITGYSFKYYAFKLPTSSIMHLFCPKSVQKGTGAMEKHVRSTFVDQLQMHIDLNDAKRTMIGIGGFTRGNAELIHCLGKELTCSVQIKEKPPDAKPPIKTRGNYLNSQERMRASLLSLGADCTILESKPFQGRKTTMIPLSTHEVYLEQILLKGKQEGKKSSFFARAVKVKETEHFGSSNLFPSNNKMLFVSNLAPVPPSEFIKLFQVVNLESNSHKLQFDHQSHIWRPGDQLKHSILEPQFTSLHKFSKQHKMEIFPFGSFQTYHWRPGEFLDISREDKLVINIAMIQEEPPDLTPLRFTIMSNEKTKDLIQVSVSFSSFVFHDLRAENMSLLYQQIIEKCLGLIKECLEQNSCLRMLVKEEHDEDNSLVRKETCLLFYGDSKTVIIHLLFSKGVDYIAGTKEEPPVLEVLLSNLFARTGIGVSLTKELNTFQKFILVEMIKREGMKVLSKALKDSNYEAELHLSPYDNMINNHAYKLYLQGKCNITKGFSVSDFSPSVSGESDLRSNLFQVGEDDMIMPSTKDLKREERLEPEEQLVAEKNGAKEQLVAKGNYGKEVILTSLVLIHDQQMGMCLICTLFPLSLVLSQWVFQRKVFNEANDSHPNHPFDDQNRARIFRKPSKVLAIKSSPFSAYYKSKGSPNQVSNL